MNDRRRPDWWPDDIEWLDRCEVNGCGKFTHLRVVVNATAHPRCERHRHRSDTTIPVPVPRRG